MKILLGCGAGPAGAHQLVGQSERERAIEAVAGTAGQAAGQEDVQAAVVDRLAEALAHRLHQTARLRASAVVGLPALDELVDVPGVAQDQLEAVVAHAAVVHVGADGGATDRVAQAVGAVLGQALHGQALTLGVEDRARVVALGLPELEQGTRVGQQRRAQVLGLHLLLEALDLAALGAQGGLGVLQVQHDGVKAPLHVLAGQAGLVAEGAEGHAHDFQ
jgi:hypothetical protein